MRNDGPDGIGGWLFTDISAASGTNKSVNSMGLGIGDYDNDGLFDLAFSNGPPALLLRNLGNGTFEDVSDASGITALTAGVITWGTAFLDYDNDSWLDLYFMAGEVVAPIGQPNRLGRNNGDGTFSDVSSETGMDNGAKGRAVSIVDFDKDGFPDVFLGNYGMPMALMRNNSADLGNSNNWLTVEVEGTQSNRDGIGTRFELITSAGILLRQISSGPSHGGGDYQAAYFGLDADTSAELVVYWPNGVVQNMGMVSSNQFLLLIEPAAP